MKKKILSIITLLTMTVSITCACSSENCNTNEIGNDYFTTVREWTERIYPGDTTYTQRIVYANDTHVMYLITEGYRKGSITPLYNADGTLQVYDE